MDEIAVGRSRVSEEASIGWRGSFPCVSFQKDLNPVVLCTLLFSRVQGHKKSWIQMMISIHSLEKIHNVPLNLIFITFHRCGKAVAKHQGWSQEIRLAL